MRQNGLRMMNKHNGRRSHGWVPAPVCNTRVLTARLHTVYEVRPAASLFTGRRESNRNDTPPRPRMSIHHTDPRGGTPRSLGKHDPYGAWMGREQLVHEYRRLCITGFRLTTGRGQMAEGRIGATPTRVITLETLAGIVRRRHRNALLAPNDTPDVRVDTIYNEARRALIVH